MKDASIPATATVDQTLVLTPGGYKPASKVYKVKRGQYLSGKGNRLSRVDLSSSASALSGIKPHLPGELSLLSQQLTGPAPVTHREGWLAYAIWTNTRIPAITEFTASWIVPQPPAEKSNQTIFIFIGMQNMDFILQPVLQWGESAAGGGQFWSIGNWYTDGNEKDTYCTDLQPVEPGQELKARIQLLEQIDRSFKYVASFSDDNSLGLEKDNVVELQFANIVLESYKVTSPAQYPVNRSLRISEVAMTVGQSPITPAWQLEADNEGPNIRILGTPGNTIEIDFGN
jgi:hypothetical protein